MFDPESGFIYCTVKSHTKARRKGIWKKNSTEIIVLKKKKKIEKKKTDLILESKIITPGE